MECVSPFIMAKKPRRKPRRYGPPVEYMLMLGEVWMANHGTEL